MSRYKILGIVVACMALLIGAPAQADKVELGKLVARLQALISSRPKPEFALQMSGNLPEKRTAHLAEFFGIGGFDRCDFRGADH